MLKKHWVVMALEALQQGGVRQVTTCVGEDNSE